MKILSILLFLIISLGILSISILIAPNQLNNIYFWITIGWLILLSGLNWFVSTFIFIGAKDNSKSSTFGILPSLNIIVFIYSIFSGLFLITTWYFNDFNILSNNHLIIQIVFFVIISSLTILMFISSSAASVTENKNLTPKNELLRTLKLYNTNKNINEDNIKLIKELIEVINYSIPHLSKLNSEKNYILLTDLIETNLNKNLVNIDNNQLEKMILLAKNC